MCSGFDSFWCICVYVSISEKQSLLSMFFWTWCMNISHCTMFEMSDLSEIVQAVICDYSFVYVLQCWTSYFVWWFVLTICLYIDQFAYCLHVFDNWYVCSMFFSFTYICLHVWKSSCCWVSCKRCLYIDHVGPCLRCLGIFMWL